MPPADKPQRSDASRRPPPDYFSRRVQLRLMFMVAMLMLVITLMFEAGDPKNWYWLWGGRPEFAGGPPLTDEELSGNEDIDTRLHSAPQSADPPGVITAEKSEPAFASADPAEDDALAFAQLHVWTHAVGELSTDEEERLRRMLRAVRIEQPPGEEVLEQWPELVTRLDGIWTQYFADAMQYLIDTGDQLSQEQRAAWQDAVQALETRWQEAWRPALTAAGSGRELSPQDRRALADVQETLDAVALAEVRDNAVFRSAERHAWFRMLEKLDRRRLDELEQASTGRVGFIQLFKQSDIYRGKLVTVRGTAQLAYRVQAPSNFYGIDEYYVFWLAPAGGPNSPIAVYALETPPGFPAILDKDQDGATTTLDEEVEFTGYFFKRWAYEAHDGLRVAPLVLAKTPRWAAPMPAAPGVPVDAVSLAMYLLGALAVGVMIALLAYWQGEWRSARQRAYAASAAPLSQRLKTLEADDPSESVSDSLRRLAEREK
jgi:hypothetical protein